MDQRFAGKTVLVTGASSGIGVGIARRFAAEGANVAIAARRKDRLDALAAELGERVVAVPADVTVEADVSAMVERTVERFGGLDVLVSNAGAGFLKPFASITAGEWRAVLDVNLQSAFLGARAAVPYLEAGSSIVHIASASGLGGDRGMTPYNAAKAAVINFARGLAFDLGPAGVRVNTVAPALTFDETVERAPGFDLDAIAAKFDTRRALPGHSTPADIGAAVAFLASDDARFITGAVLPVDGGVTAGSGQPTF